MHLKHLLFIIILSAAPVLASAYQHVIINGNLKYTVIDKDTTTVDSVQVEAATSQLFGDLVIPATVQDSLGNTLHVVKLAWSAFGGTSIRSVSIPSSVYYIEGGAFMGCKNLKSVVVPNTVTFMWNSVFSDCSSLEEATLPDNMTRLPTYTFANCTSLKKVHLPSGLKKIDHDAFYYCYSLEHIDIPETVDTIAEQAFYTCDTLQDITLPKGLKYIAGSALSICRNLKSITVEDGCENYKSVDGVLFTGDLSRLIMHPAKKPGKVYTVPEGTKIIGADAFIANYDLEEVKLPETVDSIEERAFHSCKGLKKINLPEGLRTLTSIFQSCSSLDSITIPSTVTNIPLSPFNGCKSLKELIVPEGVTELPRYFAASCTSLKNLVLPSTLKNIETGAFRYDTLKTITVNAVTPPAVRSLFFAPTFSDYSAKLIVPNGSEDAYSQATVWKMFNDMATGIKTVQATQRRPVDNNIYTITGMKVVGKPAPGIYIINGKKRLIK